MISSTVELILSGVSCWVTEWQVFSHSCGGAEDDAHLGQLQVLLSFLLVHDLCDVGRLYSECGAATVELTATSVHHGGGNKNNDSPLSRDDRQYSLRTAMQSMLPCLMPTPWLLPLSCRRLMSVSVAASRRRTCFFIRPTDCPRL